MIVMLFASTIAGASPAPAAAALPPSEARSVIERQLAQPPRTGAAGGLSAEEAETILKRYIDSIGRSADDDPGNGSR